MIKENLTLESIKQQIRACSGEKVSVKVNLGRNKTSFYTGVLSGVYSSLFKVEPDDKKYLGKTAYSYAEVLCGSVKLKRVK